MKDYSLLTSLATLIVMLFTQFIQGRILKRETAEKAAALAKTVEATAVSLEQKVTDKADVLQREGMERKHQLDEIHILVNSRLTEALKRISTLEAILKRVNKRIPPDKKRIK